MHAADFNLPTHRIVQYLKGCKLGIMMMSPYTLYLRTFRREWSRMALLLFYHRTANSNCCHSCDRVLSMNIARRLETTGVEQDGDDAAELYICLHTAALRSKRTPLKYSTSRDAASQHCSLKLHTFGMLAVLISCKIFPSNF